MNNPQWWNPRVGIVSFSVSLLILNILLKEIMSRHDIISSLFAAGAHVPLWMLGVTLLCGLVRASLFLLVPSLLAWQLARVFCRHLSR